MVPLHKLLEAHGVECAFLVFSGSPTMLRIRRKGYTIIVGLKEGELGFGELDLIFCVSLVESPGDGLDYHVCANQLRGVIRTMWRWGVLGCDEIPEEDINAAMDDARIRCSACREPQPCLGGRFKQCKLCNEEGKTQKFPLWTGFYCCSACQASDWDRHKRAHHS